MRTSLNSTSITLILDIHLSLKWTTRIKKALKTYKVRRTNCWNGAYQAILGSTGMY